MNIITEISKADVIMLFAGPEHIRREREKLSKWFNERSSAIPRKNELVKAILGEGGGDVLAKAAPSDVLEARAAVKAVKAEHGVVSAHLVMGAEMASVLHEYLAKSRELDEFPRKPNGNCHSARKTAFGLRSNLLAPRDQLSMCFTVEIGHLPSCPLIAMRSPCSSSRKS
jgi:hypothetical protein